LVAGLGSEWLASELTIKAYPCHSTSQAVVHALRLLKQRYAFDPRSVTRVMVTVEPRGVEARYLEREPRTVLGAQYSLPFTTAVALVRDLSDPYTFDEQVLTDPLVVQLAAAVEIVPAAPGAEPEVAVELPEGHYRMAAVDFPGSPGHPLDVAAASDKLRRYAGPLVGEARVARLVELVLGLEELEDVGALARAIAA
jgi:2-methylcitrate dehydratase PrpD